MGGTAGGAPHGEPPAAQVYPLVDAPGLDRAFDYLVPPAMEEAVRPGTLVACPLGRRHVLGVVAGRDGASHRGRLVALAGVVDADPIPGDLWDLATWVARYYMAPMASCLRLVLPPGAEGTLRRTRDGGWRLAAAPTGRAPRLVVTLPAGAVEPANARRKGVVVAQVAAGGTAAAGGQ